MKNLSIAILLSILSLSVFARVGDDGWSSSGGGEYIINQNNPWFMGAEPVKWCIDYGGEDKFSLSEELSKKEVSLGIKILAAQLKTINAHSPGMREGDFRNSTFWKTKNSACNQSEECKFISDNYVFTPNCEEADLEINLGNYKNEKIQKLISEIGLEKFKKIAGIAIRTDYSEQTLRGKGFIYIAADKGEIQYKGARNNIFKNATIWDTYEKLNPNAAIPERFYNSYYVNEVTQNSKLKDWTMGVLTPLIAHEFGHVLGFGHNHFHNVMDEDYPAEIISTGLVFTGNFQREMQILSRGLIESDRTRQLGYSTLISTKKDIGPIKSSSPLIYNFLFDFPENFKDKYTTPVFFIFDYNPEFNENSKNTVRLATLSENKLEYKVHKQYEIEFEDKCAPPENVDSINFRSEKISRNETGLEYNQTSDIWIASGDVTKNVTDALLTFDNTYKCGRILISSFLKKKYIHFKLSLRYFSQKSSLELIDPSNGYLKTFTLDESNIFGRAGDELPKASFSFYWL